MGQPYIRHNFDKFIYALREAINSDAVKDFSPVLNEHVTRFMKSRKFIFDKSRKSKGKYVDLSYPYKVEKKKEVGFVYPILLLNPAFLTRGDICRAPATVPFLGA